MLRHSSSLFIGTLAGKAFGVAEGRAGILPSKDTKPAAQPVAAGGGAVVVPTPTAEVGGGAEVTVPPTPTT